MKKKLFYGTVLLLPLLSIVAAKLFWRKDLKDADTIESKAKALGQHLADQRKLATEVLKGHTKEDLKVKQEPAKTGIPKEIHDLGRTSDEALKKATQAATTNLPSAEETKEALSHLTQETATEAIEKTAEHATEVGRHIPTVEEAKELLRHIGHRTRDTATENLEKEATEADRLHRAREKLDELRHLGHHAHQKTAEGLHGMKQSAEESLIPHEHEPPTVDHVDKLTIQQAQEAQEAQEARRLPNVDTEAV
ncbi:hypothetical protein PAPYR_8548 [Paratrimastix pyriformis]|uniref:Uncharacterized protein n=1 Tax=Paratrimastix pyriformis TaxID=342808 RepID=A0ABQ8UFU1_9EUKA|nr:hypothetical protein PAPYR_8548 [Paratrimastix pyriformis]